MGEVMRRAITLVSVVTLLLAGPCFAADEALIAAAKKEGQVTWYTTQIINQFGRLAIDAFQKRYGIHVDALRADAAQLAAVAPLLGAWRPQGALTLSAPALAWDDGRARGTARAEWRNASLALTDVRPLGDYRIEASAEGGPAAFTVTTLDGALRIAGHGTFAPPDALAFSGEARAVGNAAAALEPLLNLLGPRRADGARTLEWRSIPRSAGRSR